MYDSIWMRTKRSLKSFTVSKLEVFIGNAVYSKILLKIKTLTLSSHHGIKFHSIQSQFFVHSTSRLYKVTKFIKKSNQLKTFQCIHLPSVARKKASSSKCTDRVYACTSVHSRPETMNKQRRKYWHWIILDDELKIWRSARATEKSQYLRIRARYESVHVGVITKDNATDAGRFAILTYATMCSRSRSEVIDRP